MRINTVLLLCLLCQYWSCIASKRQKRQAFGLRKEATMEAETNQYLKRTGLFVPFGRKINIWANKWSLTSTMPVVEMTKKQHRWWDKLVYRKKPKRQKSNNDHFLCPGNPNILVRKKREVCDPIPNPEVTRMEWRRMNTEMRNSFRDAMNSLATFAPDSNHPTTSAHDLFVEWHNQANAPGAYHGASFLPWHREYLWRFENALRQQGYEYGLPYWDSSLDSLIPDPSMSALFTPEHMGTSSGSVSTWGGQPTHVNAPATPYNCWKSGHPFINRNVSSGRMNDLISRNEVIVVLALPCYKDLTWGWNRLFEGHHHTVLEWFGSNSQMSDAACSPVDPIFWLHHSYIDLIWEGHREGENARDREIDYPTENLGDMPDDMKWDSVMKPFSGNLGFGLSGNTLLNIHGLSNHYTSYYYHYEARPSMIICTSDADCNGEGPGLLWCNTTGQLCYAKIKPSGACEDSWPDNQCWCLPNSGTPVCDEGSCQCLSLTTESITTTPPVI